MSKTFNKLIESLNLMIEAIPKHLMKLAEVGIKAEKSDEMKQLKDELEKLNSEQEILKAKLKLKTKELDEKLIQANEVYSKTRKLVKLSVKQEDWLAFGIKDKR